ncbi:MAG: hypothetical protein ACTHJN_10090 [Ginsengibacter sp.]
MTYKSSFINSVFCLTILFLLIGCVSLKSQDLALNKKYSLFPLPNFSNKPEVYSVLTDGKYWKGSYFWTRPTTVGWEKRPQVTITVDLGKTEPIGSVSFNTSQEVDCNFVIHYPDHIFIFLSDDNVHFSYVGDASYGFKNISGSYAIHKFTMDAIDAKARYVKYVIIPRGFFVFCDEITIEKNARNIERKYTLLTNTVDSVVDSLIALNFNNKYISHIKPILAKNSYKSGFIHTRFISPWDSSGPYALMDTNYDRHNSLHFVVPEGGTLYAAFKIVNSTNSKELFDIKSSLKYTKVDSLDLFNGVFVPGPGYITIPDALVPLDGSPITVLNGNQKVFLVKLKAIKTGIDTARILVHSGKYKKVLQLFIRTVHINNFNEFQLNTNVWFNDYHPMVLDRRENAFKDLNAHHINTLLIGPGYLSPFSKPSFPQLPAFLKEAHYAKKLLVATEFSNKIKREPNMNVPFMSDSWKQQFIYWYDSLLSVIKKAGFSISQVYYYPYDEVRGKNIRDFINFATWIKSSVPEVQLYATLTKSIIDSTQAFNELLPLFDIAEIGSGSPIVLPKLPKHSGEIWVYENNGRSRAASPYSFYRLMAWDAFVKDVTGIGFWSYTGDPRIKRVTDAFRDLNMDYGVVYDGPGKSIISSRRWEAFSLGIEDYQVLYLYGQNFGLSKAKALAKEVIGHPQNLMLADKIKDQMLLSLATLNH